MSQKHFNDTDIPAGLNYASSQLYVIIIYLTRDCSGSIKHTTIIGKKTELGSFIELCNTHSQKLSLGSESYIYGTFTPRSENVMELSLQGVKMPWNIWSEKRK